MIVLPTKVSMGSPKLQCKLRNQLRTQLALVVYSCLPHTRLGQSGLVGRTVLSLAAAVADTFSGRSSPLYWSRSMAASAVGRVGIACSLPYLRLCQRTYPLTQPLSRFSLRGGGEG